MRIPSNFTFLLAAALVWSCASMLPAQTRLVGAVTDSAGQGIAYANVALLAAADTSLAGFASTGSSGDFELRLDGAAADYLLRVSFVGYRSRELPVTLSPDDLLVDLGAVVLHPQGYLLGGVEVSGYRIPIRMRGDTVVFDADAFAAGPHAVVEDLLRRLPGLSVEAGGVIRYHGRPISEVMVNGRPFFRGNTQLLTQNLDAAAVEDVEVYDRKSAAETVSGEDDGREDLTVNLTIKEEAAGELFGEAYGGLGTDARYRAGGKAFRIDGTRQLGAVATANNLNETGLSYGDLQGLGLSGAAAGGGLADGGPGVSPLRGSGQVLGDNCTLAGGLNAGTPVGKTADATLSYLVYDVDERATARQLDRYADPARGQLTATRTSDNRRYLHQLSADLEHRRDSSSWLTARVDARLAGRRRAQTARVTQARGAGAGDYTQRDATRQRLPGLNASLDYSRRLGGGGLTLGLTHRSALTQDREDFEALFDGAALPTGDLVWATNARTLAHDGNLDVRYRLAAAWTLTPSLDYAFGRTALTAGAAATAPGDTDADVTGFASAYTLLQPGLRLRRRLASGHWTVGLAHHHLDWRLSGDLDRRTRRAYWAPRAELALEPGEGRLSFSLSAQPELPRATQLLELADPRDIGQVRRGAPGLEPSFAYRLTGSYFLFHSFSGFSVMANAGAAHVDDPVGYALDLRGAVPLSRATNFAFSRKQHGYLRLGQRLGPLGVKVAAEATISREAGPSLLNGAPTDYANGAYQVGGHVERALGEDGFVQVAYRHTRNVSTYGGGGDAGTRIGARSERWTVTAETPLPGRLRLGSSFAYASFRSDFGAPSRLPLWEATLEWQVWPGRPHALRLAATDLLDQNRGVQQEAMGFLVRETQASVIGRVVMLEARWRL